MKGMKTSGLGAVRGIKRRAFRLLAMGRIEERDARQIVAHCDALERIIEGMKEEDRK